MVKLLSLSPKLLGQRTTIQIHDMNKIVKTPYADRASSGASSQYAMNTSVVFRLLTHLTSSKNIDDLMAALEDILQANFVGCETTVYELSAARWNGANNPTQIMCLDCRDEKKPIKLTDSPNLYAGFLLKSEQRFAMESGKTRLILPVVLYDRTISHLISIAHPYKEGAAIEVLEGLMNIFRDMFKVLREKSYDPLTRTLNRQAFDQFTTDVAYNSPKARIAKFRENPYNVVAIFDIDNFKGINDNFGHSIGDEILVLFAQTIRATLRQEDLFFRYGGEEFVVFVKTPDTQQATAVLERCREAIESRRFPQVGNVTVSIGFAELSQNTHPVNQLTKADKALYYSKEHGRNQVSCYEELVNTGKIESVVTAEGEADFWD